MTQPDQPGYREPSTPTTTAPWNPRAVRGHASEFLYRMRGRDAVYIRLRRCIGGTACIHRDGGQGKFQFRDSDHGGLVVIKQPPMIRSQVGRKPSIDR